jgi:DNA-binding response OmpR family regulator
VQGRALKVPVLLAVLPSGEGCDSILEVFSQFDWEVRLARTFSEALRVLRKRPVGVLLSECQFSDGHCWKDLLAECQWLECPPMLIVTDRQADERLWAEVLNLGGYDLLLRPFEPVEVLRVVSSAWLSWKQERAHPRRKPLGLAAGASSSAAGEGARRS